MMNQFAKAICSKYTAIGLSAAMLSGCVISPNHGEHIGNTSSTIDFQIYALGPNVPVTVTCSHHYGDPQPVATVHSSTSPITFNGQTVYAANFSQVLPSGCWDSWYSSDFNYITYLQVDVDGYSAANYTEEGIECLGDKFAEGIGPVTAGGQCRTSYNAILLYAD